MSNELRKRAAELHNAQEFEIRKLCSISSMQTQITTLEQMKIQIRADAERRCNEINSWIRNIESDLRKMLNEHERTQEQNISA
jgi:hypothetical protein